MMAKVAVFIFCLVLALTASVQAATVCAKDKLGRWVSVPTPVKRVVYFQAYELIPVLDIWDRVVGIGRYAYQNDLMKALNPDIERTIPSAGSGMDINFEALIKLKPDLVVTWSARPENVRYMEEKGLKVFTIYPESLPELYQDMLFQGRLFEREKKMRAVIAEMDQIFAKVKSRVKDIPDVQRQKVLWISSRPTMVACAVGVTQDIITMIGGVNPAAVIRLRNAEVSIEQIIAWNPDVVFIWGNAKYTPQDIIGNPQWRFVKAVKDRRVYKAPDWSTWSPRLAPVVLWMAARTYPERFGDLNIDKETDAFYRKVFNIPFSKVNGFAG